MKKLLFYLLIIFFAQNTIAQCLFNRVYDYNSLDQGLNSIIHTFDNGYFMVGGTYITDTTGGLYYMKTDSCGNRLWENSFSYGPGADFGYAVLQLADSSFLIFGRTYNINEGASDSYLMKLSSSGLILWDTVINAGFNDRAVTMKHLSDGNIILGGYMFDTSYTNTYCFLIKADTAGNVLWQKDYFNNTRDVLYSIDLTSDGGFIIGGHSKDQFDYDHFLTKTDSLGNQQWRKNYGDSHNQNIGHVISTKDGGYLQSGYVNKHSSYYRAILRKTDSAGNQVWEKEVGRQMFSNFYSIKELSNGDILAMGERSVDSFPNEAPRLWIVRLTGTGDIIWERNYTYYGNRTHTYANDFKILPDSGMIFAGYTIPVGQMDSTRNNAYLLRTDKMGCLILGCDTIGTGIDTSTVGSFINNNIIHFNIYPNPNNGKFDIDIYIEQQDDYSIEVRNVLGQRIYKDGLNNFTGPYQKRLDLSGRAKGTYLISLRSRDGEVVKRVLIF